jgi:hypothetical protein
VHLAKASGGGAFRIAPTEVVAWSDGPIEAIVRCSDCQAPGWIEALDQSPDRSVRVFALAGLRDADVALYLRNQERGSCDPKRSRAELEALVASAGPFERLIAWRQADERILAAAELPPDRLPRGGWPERLPPSDDGTWFSRLGLDKHARA